ncbi:MAG: hypothetical protein WCH34_12360 [Bacteroidota bacterium]
MHLNLNIDYKDLITIVKQLPVSDLKKLNNTIEHEIVLKKQRKHTDLQSLILKAPTWTDLQYDEYLTVRDHINKSRLS